MIDTYETRPFLLLLSFVKYKTNKRIKIRVVYKRLFVTYTHNLSFHKDFILTYINSDINFHNLWICNVIKYKIVNDRKISYTNQPERNQTRPLKSVIISKNMPSIRYIWTPGNGPSRISLYSLLVYMWRLFNLCHCYLFLVLWTHLRSHNTWNIMDVILNDTGY